MHHSLARSQSLAATVITALANLIIFAALVSCLTRHVVRN
jgi:hypothetical protein